MYFCIADLKGLWEAILRDGVWEGPDLGEGPGVSDIAKLCNLPTCWPVSIR